MTERFTLVNGFILERSAAHIENWDKLGFDSWTSSVWAKRGSPRRDSVEYGWAKGEEEWSDPNA